MDVEGRWVTCQSVSQQVMSVGVRVTETLSGQPLEQAAPVLQAR